MRLTEQVAIVTGAGSGMGQTTAELFADEGARVVVADIDLAAAAKVVEKIEAGGSGRAVAVAADVRRAAEAQAMVQTALDAFGRLDILINNAGVTLWKTIDETTEQDWDRVLDTNLKGVFLGCKAAIPAMRQVGGGSIVNIASVAGLQPMPRHFAYCAAKAGLIHFTRSLAADHGHEQIRVNCICPGGVMTPLLGEAIDTSDPAVVARMGRGAALGRLAEPVEVARVSLFLCSDEASYVNGVALPVDGGPAGRALGR